MNNSVELINTDVNVLAKINLLDSDWEDVLSLSAILENNELKNFDILLVEYNENALFQFKSFDIDIFITESQLFDFLNPKWYIDETNLFDSNEYRFDGINHHVQLKTKDDIKVDFLLNESIINNPIENKIIDLDYKLFYESIEDIVAKKIKYRKQDNLTRDIFDIAVAIFFDKKIIENLVFSRFISLDDLDILNSSLDRLDEKKYILELEKIEPQTKEFENIALNAKNIIQKSIKSLEI
jgi:hypothetical protein